MNKLTAKQLLTIHQSLTGASYTPSASLSKVLELISNAPYEQNEMFFYKYKDTVAKAAKLGCSLAQTAPFPSKNTQTAIFAVLTLLELNAVNLTQYEPDLPTLAQHLRAGAFDDVCFWIRSHQTEGDEGSDALSAQELTR